MLDLKGVGDYTAAAIHSIAFNEPSVAVDGNVARVAARLFAINDDILKAQTKTAIKQALKPLMAASEPRVFTQGLMELGALVCKKEARCEACPLTTHCAAYQTNQQASIPVRGKAKPKTIETYTVFVINVAGKHVLKQRPSDGLLANMYEFVQYPTTDLNDALVQLAKEIEGPITTMKDLGMVKHVFTHKIWHLHVIEVHVPRASHPTFNLHDFPYAISKAHRKIIDRIKK